MSNIIRDVVGVGMKSFCSVAMVFNHQRQATSLGH